MVFRDGVEQDVMITAVGVVECKAVVKVQSECDILVSKFDEVSLAALDPAHPGEFVKFLDVSVRVYPVILAVKLRRQADLTLYTRFRAKVVSVFLATDAIPAVARVIVELRSACLLVKVHHD